MTAYKRASAAEIAEAVRLYADGMDATNIGRRLGRSNSVVAHWLVKQGVYRRVLHSSLREKLMERVQFDPFGGCWLWEGAGGASIGYGNIAWKGTTLSTHRASWIAHNGPIPNGLCVLHRCDVPWCVNPKHLFLGTRGDNAIDMHLKGRARGADRRHRADAPKHVTVVVTGDGLSLLAHGAPPIPLTPAQARYLASALYHKSLVKDHRQRFAQAKAAPPASSMPPVNSRPAPSNIEELSNV